MRKLRPGTWGWVGLVGYVAAVDGYLIYRQARGRPEYCTMSTSFKEALDRPWRRWQLLLSWFIVTVHLFPVVLPAKYRKYEPIQFVGGVVSGAVARAAGRRAVSKSA